MSDVRVRPRHIRFAGYCMRGARKWASSRGMDWNELLTDGWSVEALDRTDAMGRRVAEIARKEAADGRR